jgi:SAM-dependent methyltransferase
LCDKITIVEFVKLIEEKYSQEEELNQYAEDAKRGLFRWEHNLISPYLGGMGKVLVLGSGGGREVIGLNAAGVHAIGIEISFAQIKTAQKILAGSHLPADFVRGNAVLLPFKDSSFHAVIMFRQFLQHFPCSVNRRALLREVFRVLVPQGLVFLSLNLAPFSIHPLRILNYFYRRFKKGGGSVEKEWKEPQINSLREQKRHSIIYKIILNLIGATAYFIVDSYRSIARLLLGKHYKGREPGDHLISQVSEAVSRGKIWFHTYSYSEIIRELKTCGFDIQEIKDVAELELNENFPEIIRRGAMFLGISARKGV